MAEIGFVLAIGFFLIAALYSSVGHAGASGYIALMALAGIAPETLRPTALLLNILVASIGLLRFSSQKLVPWRKLLPFVLASVPAAYLAARMKWPVESIKTALAAVLIFAAIRLLLWRENTISHDLPIKSPPLPYALLAGAGIGFISGITGTGGAIFLTPLLLFARWCQPREASGISVGFVLANSIAGLSGLRLMAVWPEALPEWLFAVAIGALLGSWLGVGRLPIIALRRVLALVLLIAAAKLALY